MNIKSHDINIERVSKIIFLLQELDITEKRKEVIEKFYPYFDIPRKKQNIFFGLKEYIVSGLKRKTTPKDQHEIIDNLFKFQIAYVDAK